MKELASAVYWRILIYTCKCRIGAYYALTYLCMQFPSVYTTKKAKKDRTWQRLVRMIKQCYAPIRKYYPTFLALFTPTAYLIDI